MLGLTWWLMLVLGLPMLCAHLVTVALTKALQSYSRSRLEEYCTSHGQPEPGRRGGAPRRSRPSAEPRHSRCSPVCSWPPSSAWRSTGGAHRRRLSFWCLWPWSSAALGYVLAGVAGKVFAEPIIYTFWPAASAIRTAAWPLTQGMAGLEYLAERLAPSPENGPRPASVEVEIPAEEGQTSEDIEAELPESTRDLLQHAVELTRPNVSEIMIPRSAIVSLPSTVTARAAAHTFRETGRSRIPLFGDNRDDIVGILYAKDLLARMTEADDPDAVVPAQAGSARLLRARDQERLRAARGVAKAPHPDRHRARRVRGGGRVWSRSKTCSRSSSARSTTSTTYRPPPTRSSRSAARGSRSTPRSRSRS